MSSPEDLAALTVSCPVCRAEAGQPCTGRQQAVQHGHQPRQDRYIRAARRQQVSQ